MEILVCNRLISNFGSFCAQLDHFFAEIWKKSSLNHFTQPKLCRLCVQCRFTVIQKCYSVQPGEIVVATFTKTSAGWPLTHEADSFNDRQINEKESKSERR